MFRKGRRVQVVEFAYLNSSQFMSCVRRGSGGMIGSLQNWASPYPAVGSRKPSIASCLPRPLMYVSWDGGLSLAESACMRWPAYWVIFVTRLSVRRGMSRVVWRPLMIFEGVERSWERASVSGGVGWSGS